MLKINGTQKIQVMLERANTESKLIEKLYQESCESAETALKKRKESAETEVVDVEKTKEDDPNDPMWT